MTEQEQLLALGYPEDFSMRDVALTVKALREKVTVQERSAELGKAFAILKETPEYKLVFEEGLFKDLVIEQVRLRAYLASVSPTRVEVVTNRINMVGDLQEHLRVLVDQANIATSTILDVNAEISALTNISGD